jgi:hypothetical protein
MKADDETARDSHNELLHYVEHGTALAMGLFCVAKFVWLRFYPTCIPSIAHSCGLAANVSADAAWYLLVAVPLLATSLVRIAITRAGKTDTAEEPDVKSSRRSEQRQDAARKMRQNCIQRTPSAASPQSGKQQLR